MASSGTSHTDRFEVMLTIGHHLSFECMAMLFPGIVGFLGLIVLRARHALFSRVDQHAPIGQIRQCKLGRFGNRLLSGDFLPDYGTRQLLLNERQQAA